MTDPRRYGVNVLLFIIESSNNKLLLRPIINAEGSSGKFVIVTVQIFDGNNPYSPDIFHQDSTEK